MLLYVLNALFGKLFFKSNSYSQIKIIKLNVFITQMKL